MSESKRLYRHAIAAQHIWVAPTVQAPHRSLQQPPIRLLQTTPSYLKWGVIVGVIAVAHLGIWAVMDQSDNHTTVEVVKPPVVVEMLQPEPEKPKIIETEAQPVEPKIPPISQQPEPQALPEVAQVKKVVSSVPKASPPIQTKADITPVQQPESTTSEQLQAKPAPEVQPVEPTPSAPAQQDVPVTDAKGYAGYLSNPAPEYPDTALERGWEGRVVLRIRVSETGLPLAVDVQKSSGKKLLDDAAKRTVKRWKFIPAKRGTTAIEGWVDVPIDFKLPQ